MKRGILAASVLALTLALGGGPAIVAITHNRAVAERVADRIIRIPDLNHMEVDRGDL